MNETVSALSSIKGGECLTVSSVSGDAVARLFDLGFFPGARIRCLGAAPLGDPLMLAVGGRVIAVRKRDLAEIIVVKR